jgi:hypothetical protein
MVSRLLNWHIVYKVLNDDRCNTKRTTSVLNVHDFLRSKHFAFICFVAELIQRCTARDIKCVFRVKQTLFTTGVKDRAVWWNTHLYNLYFI